MERVENEPESGGECRSPSFDLLKKQHDAAEDPHIITAR